jgi:hypothetical protein
MSFQNAITDRSIVSYPETPPDPGRAGSIIVDPFCGNRILRVTDADTSPANSGASYTTPSSSNNNPWSANGDRFVIWDPSSSSPFLYAFDPESFSAKALGPLAGGFRATWFSAVDPTLLWALGGDLKFWRVDVYTGKAAVVVDLNDYADKLGIPSSPRWYLDSLAVDWWDQRLAAMLGPGPDSSFLAVVWDMQLGLAWFNTQTGEFGGRYSGQIEHWAPFLLHRVGLDRSGQTLIAGPNIAGDVALWRIGSGIGHGLRASAETATYGHHVAGFGSCYGLGAGGAFAWVQAPMWSLNQFIYLLPDPPIAAENWWADFDMSYQPDSYDRNPILISTENVQGNPTTPGAPLTSQVPGDNEILAAAGDGSGQWWRLAHTYATGKNENFWSKPRGNVSLDGRFFLFTSDWEITLGGKFPNQRTDVFCEDAMSLVAQTRRLGLRLFHLVERAANVSRGVANTCTPRQGRERTTTHKTMSPPAHRAG